MTDAPWWAQFVPGFIDDPLFEGALLLVFVICALLYLKRQDYGGKT